MGKIHQLRVTDGGKIIRIAADAVRIAGRATEGVILFKIADDERVISATAIEKEEEKTEEETPVEEVSE